MLARPVTACVEFLACYALSLTGRQVCAAEPQVTGVLDFPAQ